MATLTHQDRAVELTEKELKLIQRSLAKHDIMLHRAFELVATRESENVLIDEKALVKNIYDKLDDLTGPEKLPF